jgi:hypothetical protein
MPSPRLRLIVVSGLCGLGHPLRHPHLILMPQVLNIRNLPGFSECRPIVPLNSVYIGRRNARYGLAASQWANPFRPRSPTDHEAAVAMYERWLRRQPLMDQLRELQGLDLVCWCAPLPCHGDVLLRLANETA